MEKRVLTTAVAAPSPNHEEILDTLGQMTLKEFAEFSLKMLQSFQQRCEQCRAAENGICDIHDYLILRPRE